jgi:hypothetical protein
LTLCARRRARRIPIARIARIALTSNTAPIALMFVRGSPRSLTDRASLQLQLMLLRALLSLLFERASRDRVLAPVEAREALAGPVTVEGRT